MARVHAAVLAIALAFLAAVALVTVGLSPDTQTRVVIEDETGERLGAVTVEVADDPEERYTGLSEHESLGSNEGMLFVYEQEGSHTYVMRSMSFPIDIVYIGADHEINRIHHAPTEADNENLTGYSGTGKWVLEVPYNWTTEHGVEVGDTVRIED